jgi:uncharacterized heparinase superfamily protein
MAQRLSGRGVLVVHRGVAGSQLGVLMVTRLQRIRGMSAAELPWRARTTGRTLAQTVGMRLRQPRWERHRIADILSASALDARGRAAVARGDWQYLHEALARQILERPSRFVLDPHAAADVTAAVLRRWPHAAADAATRADAILHGSYDVLGYRGLSFAPDGHTIDWHFDPVHNRRAPRMAWARVPYLDPAVGDHKIIWEINRHQHWLQLGRALWLTKDRRYADGIVHLLDGWLAANPPLVGINWASMLEIGFRSLSWTWAMHALLASGHEGSRPWLVDMLAALDRQLTHVEQNLSYYFSPNTHLTGEALALYVVGSALPELAASARWVHTGRRVLLDEIDRQILADGGHAERSMHYQRYMLDFYLLALMTAIDTGDAGAVPRLRDAAVRLAEFTRSMADDQGRLPLIGDDDGGMLWPIAGRECHDVRDSLALAAIVLSRPELAAWGVPEEPFWIAGRSAVALAPALDTPPSDRRRLESRRFPETGYVVIRDRAGAHAVLDGGTHGYMNAGHAHADALALTLTLGDRPFLVDPGTATYTMDAPLRDRMRSSMSHNTVVVDGRSQGIPAGPFHWQTRADARVESWRHNPGFDWVEAAHDGYAPVRHRRSVLRAGTAGWLVVDDLAGEGRHLAAAHWHFDPAWMLNADGPQRLRARHLEGGVAWILHEGTDARLVHGDEESGLGWFAPAYGTLLPTWTAVVTRDDAAPFALLTWIGSGDDDGGPPVLARIPVGGDAASAIGAAVTAGDRTSLYLVQSGDRPGRYCSVADVHTDARVFHSETRGGRLQAIDVIDARQAASLDDDALTVSAAHTVADLHLTIDEANTLARWASTPPPELCLDGRLVSGVRAITLNGRDCPLDASPDNRMRLIRGGDWREMTPRSVRVLLPSPPCSCV